MNWILDHLYGVYLFGGGALFFGAAALDRWRIATGRKKRLTAPEREALRARGREFP